jgi:lactam utilization protein B
VKRARGSIEGEKARSRLGCHVVGPELLERGDRQLGLGLEEIVEAALFDVGALADVVDGHGAVALLPHEVEGGLLQPLVRV